MARAGSNPPAPTERGFTLMECEVAILGLSLLVIGFMHLTSAHRQVVDSMEDWLEGDPVYYVAQPVPYRERVVGVPARLLTSPPIPPAPEPPPGDYAIELGELDTTLYPPSASAVVTLKEL